MGGGTGTGNGNGNGNGHGHVHPDVDALDIDGNWTSVDTVDNVDLVNPSFQPSASTVDQPRFGSASAFNELHPTPSHHDSTTAVNVSSESDNLHAIIPSLSNALFLNVDAFPQQKQQQQYVNLFRLLQITSDKQDLSFVDKVLVCEKDISDLCNFVVKGSARVGEQGTIAAIDFSALDAKAMNVIGFYGDKGVMARVLSKKGYAPAPVVQAMCENSLEPGLYACLHRNERSKMCLFYWDARAEMVPANRKDVYCNFVRYLMELCEIVYVCVEGRNVRAPSSPLQAPMAGSPAIRRAMRTQRLKISMKKESEDDLKLRRGFSVQLPVELVPGGGPVGIMFPKGHYRCAVLAATVNAPKIVPRSASQSFSPDEIRRWLRSKLVGGGHHASDTSHLPSQDFIALLQILEETELLRKYEAHVKLFKEEMSKVSSKQMSLGSKSSAKEGETLRAIYDVLDAYLLSKYPWEEKMISGVLGPAGSEESAEAVQAENAAAALNGALAKLECNLCAVFTGFNDTGCQQRFLFSGTELEMEVEDDGGKDRRKLVYSIVTGDDGCVGPICYDEEVTLQQLLNAEDGCPKKLNGRIVRAGTKPAKFKAKKLPREPVIVMENPSERLLLATMGGMEATNGCSISITRHAPAVVKVRWLEGICGITSVDANPNLFQKTRAASYLFRHSDQVSCFSDEVLRNLMRATKSLKDWTNLLPKECSSLLVEYLSAQPVHVPSPEPHEKVIAAAADVYKGCKEAMKLQAQKYVTECLSPAMKKNLKQALEQEAKCARDALNAEKEKFVTELRKEFDGERKNKLLLRMTRVEEYNAYALWKPMVRLTYSIQEQEKESVTWRAVEMVPCRDELVDLASSDKPCSKEGGSVIITPVCSKPEEFVTLDPAMEELSKVILTKCGQVLAFVMAIDKSYLHLYHCPRLGVSITGRNPVKEFKRGFDLVAVDEVSQWMVMYDKGMCNIQAYRFDDSFKSVDYTGLTVQLSKFSGSTDIVWMELIPGKREVVVVDDDNRLRVCDLAAGMMSPKHRMLPSPLLKACITPDGSCFMAFSSTSPHCRSSTDGALSTENEEEEEDVEAAAEALERDSRRRLWAHVYLLNDDLSFMKCVPLDWISLQDNPERLLLNAECKLFGTQMQLVFVGKDADGRIWAMSHVLEASTAQQCFQLHKVTPARFVGGALPSGSTTDGRPCDDSCGSPALDYVYHVFDKFAVSPPLSSSDRDLRISVLFDPSSGLRWDARSASNWIDAAIASTQQNLKEKGKDLHQARLQFSSHYLAHGLSTTDLDPPEDAELLPLRQMGKWIQRVVSLVPMQISRAENNSLKPLLNGLQIPPDLVYTDAVTLASLLRFGLYDLVIANWRGQIKVVSSMGKQSSGKSYLLNHLAGCFLDVAGGRCTDGVWMTVRTEEDCLYVLLDFEGLGSFERSEQEDMLLSILNSAISNVTIFNKKDFHLDKETEAIFQRFQDGVSLVKADDKLFRGLFYMAIKDVDASDVDDLKSEFFQKMSQMCSKSKDNFLTTMYGGEVEIAAMPPFQRREFRDSVADIGEVIQETESCYRSGQQFLEDLKLVMSQISARDWAPLDTKRLILRISVLRQHLDHAIRKGQCADGEGLLDFDEQTEIEEDPAIVVETMEFDVKDAGLELAEAADEGKTLGTVVVSLGQMFETVVERQQMDEEKWYGMYEAFLGCLVERRNRRVTKWLQVNTQQFAQEGDVQKLMLEATAKLAELKSKLVVCACKCESCFLRCVLVKGHHPVKHDCLGSHRCGRLCTYCQEKKDTMMMMVLPCSDLAGHAGAHDCKQKAHTCGKPCIFAAKSSNCNQICSQRVDHDGDHRCNSLQHMCDQACSLPGCPNTCSIPYERGNHRRHACHDKFCPAPCSMPDCKRSCAVMDHFHGLLVPEAEHFCDREHPCPMKCEMPGVCQVQTELLKQTRSFHGKRSNFEYEYVSQQTENRKGCCISIPPSRKHHDGPHQHSTNPNVVHYCPARCSSCDYYCHLPIGHAGPHNAVHGNMKNTRFVSEAENIDVSDRKYVRGESGEAEMCMMHCKARGRGHTHLIPCPAAANDNNSIDGSPCTEKVYDGARHVKMEELGFNVAMDELTHEAYWKYIRFVDPCEEAEKEVFAMCDHYCRSDEHNNQQQQGGSSAGARSYCTEKLWHAPVPRTGSLQTGLGGYVTEDGHHFPCNHAKDAAHNVIFVMDKSGSMDSGDIQPTMAMFSEHGHNNRLGCVLEAVLRFVQTREKGINVGSAVERDTVSVVLFDCRAHVAVEGEEMSEEAVVHPLLGYRADGGTTYSAGLEAAEKVLERVSKRKEVSGKSPVIIFLSDGGNNGGTDPVYLVRRMKRAEARLVVHTIMFGHDPHADILQAIAKEGDGTFQLSLDEVQLARSFEGLAKSLKPKLASLVAMP